jgi:hypothetical protein
MINLLLMSKKAASNLSEAMKKLPSVNPTRSEK